MAARHGTWFPVALVAGSIFTMGGVIFGIASFYPVLYHNRALELSSCHVQVVSPGESHWELPRACAAQTHEKCCDAQELKYTSITSLALFGADGAMLLYGELGDRLGPRACFGTGACLAWLGFVLLAVAAQLDSDMMWYSALLSIGLSGPGVFMGCLFMGEKHPNLRAVISAVGAAMWDARRASSSFALAYDASLPRRRARPVGPLGICLGWLAAASPSAADVVYLPARQLEQLRAAGARPRSR